MVIYHNGFKSHPNCIPSSSFITFIEFLYNFLSYHLLSFIPCYFVGGAFSSDLNTFATLHSGSAAAQL